MPDMPELVSKGSILKRLDANSQDRAWLETVLRELSAANADVAEVADRNGLFRVPEEKTHLVNDWFTNWWHDAQPVEPIIREGFKVAIREALRRRLPLDVYWLCEPGHDDSHDHGDHGGEGAVEVATCWSDKQVTVMINTPGPGRVPPAPLTVNEPIKVTKRVNGQITTVQPKHRR